MPASRPPSRAKGSQRNESASPEKIRLAAARLFARKGYYNTSMQDIASGVGITKGSLYHHISSKEAVLDSLILPASEDLLGKSEALAASECDPAEKLDDMIRLFVRNVVDYQDWTAIYVTERLRLPTAIARKYASRVRRHRELLTQVVSDFVRSRGLEGKCDVSLAVLTILGMVSISALWFRRNGRLSLPQMEEEYIHYVRRILGDS